MSSIFEKLSMLRQLSFTDGEIRLLDNRMVILPANILAAYTEKINESQELVLELYHSIKDSQIEGFAKLVGKSFSFSFNDFVKWMPDIFALAGWGIIEYKELDPDKHTATLTVARSPVATALKGKVKTPVDHLIRGFIAGAATAAFKVDIDTIETECAALDAQACKFEFKPVEQFRSSPETLHQLGR